MKIQNQHTFLHTDNKFPKNVIKKLYLLIFKEITKVENSNFLYLQ